MKSRGDNISKKYFHHTQIIIFFIISYPVWDALKKSSKNAKIKRSEGFIKVPKHSKHSPARQQENSDPYEQPHVEVSFHPGLWDAHQLHSPLLNTPPHVGGPLDRPGKGAWLQWKSDDSHICESANKHVNKHSTAESWSTYNTSYIFKHDLLLKTEFFFFKHNPYCCFFSTWPGLS